jgi:hypothetical protein
MTEPSIDALDRRLAALLAAFGDTAASEFDATVVARTAMTAAGGSRVLVRPLARPSFRMLLVAAGLVLIGVAAAILIGSRHGSPIGDAFSSPTEIQWSPDGTRLAFVVDVPDARDLAPGESLRPVGRWTTQPAVRPSHRELWVIGGSDASPRRLAKLPGYALDPQVSWAPNGRSIAIGVGAGPYGPGDNLIETVGLDGGSPRILLDTGVHDLAMGAWSPSGDRLLYTESVESGTNLFVVDVAAGATEPLTTSGTVCCSGSWSPDGRWVLYSDGFQDGGQTVAGATWIASADGSQRRRIGPCCDLGWLAVGVTAYFAPDGGPISAVAADGSDVRAVPGTNATIYGFAPSPDGSRFVVASPDGLEIVQPGDPPRRLTDNEADSDPRWSPDGSMIAFGGTRDGRPGLYAIPAAGGTPRLAATGLVGGWAWQPGPGRPRLAFMRDRSIVTVAPDGSDEGDLVGRSTIAGDPLGGSDDGSLETRMVIGPDGPDRDIYRMRADPFELTIENRSDKAWTVTLDGFDVVAGDCQTVSEANVELASWRAPSPAEGIPANAPPDFCQVQPHATVRVSKGPMAPVTTEIRLIPQETDPSMAIPVILHLVDQP